MLAILAFLKRRHEADSQGPCCHSPSQSYGRYMGRHASMGANTACVGLLLAKSFLARVVLLFSTLPRLQGLRATRQLPTR